MQEKALLKKWVDESKRIVFFGGAGVSTESGIPDFRSEGGLYSQRYDVSPEQMLSHDFFIEHPDVFYEFYREKMLITGVKPNAAHLKLARWEAEGRLSAIVTQNIDGLHQLAGSKCVYELHGSIYRNFCMRCHMHYGVEAVQEAKDIPGCVCGGIIKPDVVLYGERLIDEVVEGAIRAISQADLLIVGGTSLSVYPAAGLIDYFKGDRLVLINRDATPKDSSARLIFREPIGELLGQM